jgi:sugar-specific transcriptional regulator TrmB
MGGVLRSLGIGQVAADVYEALLAEPSASVSELASRANVAQTDAEAAMAELSQGGLVGTIAEGRSGAVTLPLVAPDLALTALLRRHEADAARRQQELADARAAIAATSAAYKATINNPECCGRLVPSHHESLMAARQLIAGAISQCLIAIPDPTDIFGSALADLARLASAGSRVAIICSDAARSVPPRSGLANLERAGAQVRTLPIIAFPLIACGPPPSALLWPAAHDGASAVLARDDVFAPAFAGIFECPLGDRRPAGEGTPRGPGDWPRTS